MLRQFFVPLLAATLLTDAISAQVTWTNAAATGAPNPFCGYTWDGSQNVLLAFGGELNSVPTQTFRAWNGSQWTGPTVVGALPSARSRPALAYDAARGVTVMFGGGVPAQAETWTWNGTSWTQRSPAHVPPVRFGASLAYDEVRQVAVLFGGFVPSGLDTADLWEWDGTDWTQRTWAGSGPSARGAHRMVFDPARGVTVLYGGYSTPSLSTLSDTWTWNGTAWTQGGGGPGSLCDQIMAYDPTRQRVVLFGGLRILGAGALTDLAATWEWNGATWTLRSPAAAPSARNSAATAFDPVSGRIVAGGGTAMNGPFADTWRFGPTSPATATSFGLPCATTFAGLELTAVSLPYLGLPFVQRIDNAAPAAALGLVLFGNSNTLWGAVPLPLDLAVLGAPGCNLYVSLDVVATVLLSGGTGTNTWNVPNLPSALGIAFYTQAAVFDPTSILPFQVDMSGGRGFVIGAP